LFRYQIGSDSIAKPPALRGAGGFVNPVTANKRADKKKDSMETLFILRSTTI
jgi:hypothetical protein